MSDGNTDLFIGESLHFDWQLPQGHQAQVATCSQEVRERSAVFIHVLYRSAYAAAIVPEAQSAEDILKLYVERWLDFWGHTEAPPAMHHVTRHGDRWVLESDQIGRFSWVPNWPHERKSGFAIDGVLSARPTPAGVPRPAGRWAATPR